MLCSIFYVYLGISENKTTLSMDLQLTGVVQN